MPSLYGPRADTHNTCKKEPACEIFAACGAPRTHQRKFQSGKPKEKKQSSAGTQTAAVKSGIEIFILPQFFCANDFVCKRNPNDLNPGGRGRRPDLGVSRKIFVPKSLTRKNEISLARLKFGPLFGAAKVQGFA